MTSVEAALLVRELSCSRAKLNSSDRQGGDAMHEETSDADCVDLWLTGIAPNHDSLDTESLLRLFERGINAIWQEADESLGEVTLIAIATRVLFMSNERFPGLSGIRIEADGVSFDELREGGRNLDPYELREPLCFFLTELLRVLGVLTANVLTPWLHDELLKVTLDEPTREDADNETVPRPTVSREGEEA